jgi:hypothetical protein
VDHSNTSCDRLFKSLITNLEDWKSKGKLKLREVHELQILNSIGKDKTFEGIHRIVISCFSELYVAFAHSWAEAKCFQRRDLKNLLGLLIPQTHVIVRDAPSSLRSYPKKMLSKKKGASKKK